MKVTVSVDRIKPAYILHDPDTTTRTQPTRTPHTRTPHTHTNTHLRTPYTDDRVLPEAEEHTRRTRSGRRVRFPDYCRP